MLLRKLEAFVLEQWSAWGLGGHPEQMAFVIFPTQRPVQRRSMLFAMPRPGKCPSLVLKVALDEDSEKRFQHTARTLEELIGRKLVPSYELPEILWCGPFESYWIIVERYLNEIPVSRYKPSPVDIKQVEPAFQWLIRFHQLTQKRYPVNQKPVDDWLCIPDFPWVQELKALDGIGPYLERVFSDRRLGECLEIPLIYAHGDFCPHNLMLGSRGLRVIDWELARRESLPLLDLIHFCLWMYWRPFQIHRYHKAFADAFHREGLGWKRIGPKFEAYIKALDITHVLVEPLVCIYLTSWANRFPWYRPEVAKVLASLAEGKVQLDSFDEGGLISYT